MDQKGSRTVEMWSPSFYPAADRYHKDDGVGETQSQIPPPPPQEGPMWSSEPPTAPSNQEIVAHGLHSYLPPGQQWLRHGDFEAGVGAETSTSANLVQSPASDSCLSPHYSGIETHSFRYAPVADSPYCRTEVDPPAHQDATHLPAPDTHIPTPEYADNIIIQSHGSPPVCHNWAEGQPPSQNLTPNRNNEFQHAGSQGFPAFHSAYLYPPYPTPASSRLPLDYTVQETSIVVHQVSSSGNPSPSVSGPFGGVGNDETAGLSVGSPEVETDNARSWNIRKRKQAVTEDGPRDVKRIRHKGPQRLNPHQSPVLATPSLPQHPVLRMVPQVSFKSGNPQKGWTKLPDINFNVKGVQGIKLNEAKNAFFDGPDGRDELMFTNGGIKNSVSCRLHFEGYKPPEKPRQIVTKDHKAERSRITKKKLVYEIAKCIEDYLKGLKDAGTPFPIPSQNMVITKLTHVARASFQPEILYHDQVTPSTST